MRQFTQQISVKTHGRKLYDITPLVLDWANALGLNTGLLTLYIQHTSAMGFNADLLSELTHDYP